MSTKLSSEIIAAAIEGFEGQKKRLDSQIRDLRAMLNGGPTKHFTAGQPPAGKRRPMSAAARKRIAAAQRKRWAATRQAGQSSQAVKPETSKRKWKLSAEGRRRIIEATKRRWALKRAAAERAQRAAVQRKGVAKRKAA